MADDGPLLQWGLGSGLIRSLGLLGRGRKGESKVLQMANPLGLRGALERMYVPWVLMLTK